ncbi:ribosomal protein L29 [Vittaforma corneae ATCC 50505]|uniref:Ribosomal protein L29 n=1 Tax=Vittaforma corneae (strain ATCC 50505) TaxID=993615 RepID=L2GMR8_VITCO|nr:ribosomal protein L29 [Vittaforma corneae ATCC 50505]ELA42193.1 ribosomal protein L29 [Vittaforma corneae ATCC 50505]
MFVSAEELRAKSYEELQEELVTLERAYMAMRQQEHSKTAEREEIREAKKNVARCKAVMREKKLRELVDQYKGQTNLPKQLKPKLTKALRMRLTPAQKNRKTRSQKIHARKYPQRIFSFNN